ncbi:hypothetical protein BSZ35_10340 [Salinibacter sp. 10B]|uniref:carboxypeptidase regulatory-like domain-containing protein n=1 Tax=Salinibacter sp. 10B TaxID=1923971 RepID=UPI000CF3D551|nr:carboxypeptidase regulatory-like domain-containing protein [Salinibacter sp. 10B]PQJ34942.1 hypothetical protein BSZ35_10340 [Salinibacter sp. 10B]
MTRSVRFPALQVGGILLGLVLGLGGGALPPLHAQQAPEAPRYTMMFRDVALETALGRVAETTRINLVYDSELVQGRQVYCTARDATPEDLLRCLLADVALDFYETSGGTYVLTDSPRQPSLRGDLTGIVVDARTGEPLSHAHVILATANTGAASNEAGRFQVPGLTSGVHRVVATHLGYEPAVDSVRVLPGDRVERRITLEPTALASKPIVVDGAERHGPEDGLGAPSLGAGELKKTGRMGTPDVLGRAGTRMGVYRQFPRADLHVQGGGAGEHEVRLDGMPIRNPVTLRRLLGAFSPLALDRLTVRKAGFGVEHGSTISGIVSAEHALSTSTPTYGEVTLDPMSVNAEGHGSIDLREGRSAHLRVAARSSVWDVYQDPTLDRLLREWNVVDPMLLSSYFGDGTDLPAFSPVAQTADVGFSDLHAAARVDLGPFRSLSVSGYRGRNHLHTQFVAQDPTGMLTQDRYDWANTAGQARVDWTLGARTSAAVQLRASEHRVHRGYQMTYGNPDPGDSIDGVIDSLQQSLDPSLWPDDRNRIRELSLETTGQYAVTSRHHLKGGVEISRLTSQFRLGGRFLQPTAFEDTRWQIGGYVRDAVSLSVNTTLTAGTRLTYLPIRQTLYAEPRAQLHHEGGAPGLGPYAVRGAVGLYRQFVNRFDASSTSPTAILPSMRFWLPVGAGHAPPRAYHAALNGRVRPHDRWRIAGEAYYKHYAHLLSLDYTALEGDPGTSVAPSDAIAATDGYALGGGLALTRDGPLLQTTLRYDWSRSHRRFPGRFGGERVPVPWNQPHRLSLSTEMEATEALRLMVRGERGWGRSWGFRQTYYDYLGGQSDIEAVLGRSLNAPSTHVLAPRMRLDLGLRYTLQWSDLVLEARLDVINVFDRANPFDWGVRPTDDGMTRTTRRLPGRRAVGGLTVRY